MSRAMRIWEVCEKIVVIVVSAYIAAYFVQAVIFSVAHR